MPVYMKVPGIDGNVTAQSHEKWINLNTFKFGIERTIHTKIGAMFERQSGIPNFSEMLITKKIDKSSPLLFSQACAHVAKDEVLIDVCHTHDEQRHHTRYTLKNVLVSNYQTDGGCIMIDEAEETSLIETIYLSFTQIELTYIPRNAANEDESPINAGYNLEKAQRM